MKLFHDGLRYRRFAPHVVTLLPALQALIEDQTVEKILGRFAGNTLAYGGDPAKGVVEDVGPMRPEDNIELCNIIGQDVMIIGTSIWPPYFIEK